MSTTLTNIPTSFRAGDTVAWTESLSDYTTTDGWTLKFRFSGPQQIDVDSTADGAAHAITIDAATSGGYIAGVYQFQRYVENTDGRRITLQTGSVEILENLTARTGVYEGRSFARRMLDAIEAVMEGRATQRQKSMSIKDRAIELLSPAELVVERYRWQRIVAQEEQDARIAQGQPAGNRIVTRFELP